VLARVLAELPHRGVVLSQGLCYCDVALEDKDFRCAQRILGRLFPTNVIAPPRISQGPEFPSFASFFFLFLPCCSFPSRTPDSFLLYLFYYDTFLALQAANAHETHAVKCFKMLVFTLCCFLMSQREQPRDNGLPR
jgi:hypothetical protein